MDNAASGKNHGCPLVELRLLLRIRDNGGPAYSPGASQGLTGGRGLRGPEAPKIRHSLFGSTSAPVTVKPGLTITGGKAIESGPRFTGTSKTPLSLSCSRTLKAHPRATPSLVLTATSTFTRPPPTSVVVTLAVGHAGEPWPRIQADRKSTRLNSSHLG